MAALERLLPNDTPAADDATLARVLSLPARQPIDDVTVEALSAFFRKREWGWDEQRPPQPRRNVLRRLQAEYMRELYEYGAVAHMPVGEGKTLPTMLAPKLLNARRPCLMIPAALREKTRRDFARYAQDWHVRLPELVSYEEMYRADREDLFWRRLFDLIIADECDPLFNDNACSRRLRRYVHATDVHAAMGFRLRFAPMSGTYMGHELERYWETTAWALEDRAPVPTTQAEAERWSSAVDGEANKVARYSADALGQIPGGFHHHFRSRRGVVIGQGEGCSSSIRISTFEPKLPVELERTIRAVSASKRRPDGEPLDEWGLPDCLCQLALGFYSIWDPMPDLWWLQPRRGWLGYANAVLDERLDGFDTLGQIANALDSVNPSRLPPAADLGRRLLAAWRAVADLFTPTPVPQWIDDSPLRAVVEHVDRGTLIWTPYIAVGERLRDHMGVPYYGADRDPEQAPHGATLAVSVKAHHRGKNLQHGWYRNFLVKPPAKERIVQQLIGRTHRTGQRQPTIFVEFLKSIRYHGEVLSRVLTEARATARASGLQHKLTLADWATTV